MAKKGYLYRVTELKTGRIYVGLKLGPVEPSYFGSPGKTNDLYRLYSELGLYSKTINAGDRVKTFYAHFSLTVLEESDDCSTAPDWCSDKTLTLEGAYKVYRLPTCLAVNGGFNLNVDRVNGFPFVAECRECQAPLGAHFRHCSFSVRCNECNGASGKHKKICSKATVCTECGTNNQSHSPDLGSGESCSKHDPSIAANHSSFLKEYSKTVKGKAQNAKAGRANRGKTKPEAWTQWRREVFTSANPMADPEARARMTQTKRLNGGSAEQHCCSCDELFWVKKSKPNRKHCSKKCAGVCRSSKKEC